MGIIKLKSFFNMNSDQMLEYLILSRKRFLFFLFEKWKYLKTGRKTAVLKPIRIIGKRNICLGKKVLIREGAYICTRNDRQLQCYLNIADGVNIGHYSHIVATHSVIIDEYVLIADKVFISDSSHTYENIDMPIIEQGIHNIGKVHIGAGSWIGDNVAIIGATIGKNCVIGANSVVTKNIPDYTVAAGIPAKILKQYDTNKNCWVSFYES